MASVHQAAPPCPLLSKQQQSLEVKRKQEVIVFNASGLQMEKLRPRQGKSHAQALPAACPSFCNLVEPDPDAACRGLRQCLCLATAVRFCRGCG